MKTITISALSIFMALTTFANNSLSSSFGNIWTNSPLPCPMPVQLYSFDVSITTDTVTCNWITQEEVNNNYFQLERSFDSVNYRTVALIFGQENNTSTKESYKYKDHSTALQNQSIVYYRLLQVDKDGSATYSKVLTLKLKSID